MTSPGPGFHVAAVLLRDSAGRVLTVRKRGTTAFMNPGGKIEPGESSRETAVRELAEELGLRVPAEELVDLGSFRTRAANEPGHWLRGDVFWWPEPVDAATPLAELDAVRFVDPGERGADLAPLLVEHVLPLLEGLDRAP